MVLTLIPTWLTILPLTQRYCASISVNFSTAQKKGTQSMIRGSLSGKTFETTLYSDVLLELLKDQWRNVLTMPL